MMISRDVRGNRTPTIAEFCKKKLKSQDRGEGQGRRDLELVDRCRTVEEGCSVAAPPTSGMLLTSSNY